MSATRNPEASEPPEGEQRAARALIGWMTPEEAHLALSGRRMDTANQPEFVGRRAAARAAVASRAPGVDQTALVRDLPGRVAPHVASLKAQPQIARDYFDHGWSVALVDLRRVCAIQPIVHTDHALSRVAGVADDDHLAIAAVSLPLPDSQVQLPAQFDPNKLAWILSGRNPNLRIVGQFHTPVGPGAMGFGFAVSLSPSFMQVATYRGRAYLRDGYHRAYGFLARGIHIVPAFVRHLDTFQELLPAPGMLPQDEYLGDRPPVLPDYFDDEVSASVQVPTSQKMIVVQGLELHPAA